MGAKNGTWVALVRVAAVTMRASGPPLLKAGIGAGLVSEVEGPRPARHCGESRFESRTLLSPESIYMAPAAARSLAGMLSWVVTYPQDVIKSRMQVRIPICSVVFSLGF